MKWLDKWLGRGNKRSARANDYVVDAAKARHRTAWDLLLATHVPLDDAVQMMGHAMFANSDLWKGLETRTALSEYERIRAEEESKRTIKHLQQVHGLSMETIQGLEISEWNYYTSAPKPLTSEELQDPYNFQRRSREQRPTLSDEPPPYPELTEEEMTAIAEENSDARQPDKAEAYRRMVAVADKLRQWLHERDLPVCILLEFGRLADVPKTVWVPEIAPLDVFRSGKMRLRINAARNELKSPAAIDPRADRAQPPADGGTEFQLWVDEPKLAALLQTEMRNPGVPPLTNRRVDFWRRAAATPPRATP